MHPSTPNTSALGVATRVLPFHTEYFRANQTLVLDHRDGVRCETENHLLQTLSHRKLVINIQRRTFVPHCRTVPQKKNSEKIP